jgi:hypothetical protein
LVTFETEQNNSSISFILLLGYIANLNQRQDNQKKKKKKKKNEKEAFGEE